MKAKHFVLIALLVLFLPLLVSAGMVLLKIPTNKNQLVVWRQLEKLQSVDESVDTLILGDSSGAMAIDKTMFEGLTGTKTVSLYLTGAFGLHGNLMLLEKARTVFPNLKQVLFVVSTTTWQINFNDESYYLLREAVPSAIDPIYDIEGTQESRKRYLNWLFTPERFVWYTKYLKEPPYEQGRWDEDRDFIVQWPREDEKLADEKWAVHMTIPDAALLRPYLQKWAELCSEVSCIFAHGPIYRGFAENSYDSVRLIEGMIDNYLADSFSYYEKELYMVGYDMLGDHLNHIVPDKQDVSTRHFADIFNKAVNTPAE